MNKVYWGSPPPEALEWLRACIASAKGSPAAADADRKTLLLMTLMLQLPEEEIRATMQWADRLGESHPTEAPAARSVARVGG